MNMAFFYDQADSSADRRLPATRPVGRVDVQDFFKLTTGYSEHEFIRRFNNDPQFLKNLVSTDDGNIRLRTTGFKMGRIARYTLKSLREGLAATNDPSPQAGTFSVLEGVDASPVHSYWPAVDIGSLQAHPANHKTALFQVLSTFNGLISVHPGGSIDVPFAPWKVGLGTGKPDLLPEAGHILSTLPFEQSSPGSAAAVSAAPGAVSRRYYAWQELRPDDPASWPQTNKNLHYNLLEGNRLSSFVHVPPSGFAVLKTNVFDEIPNAPLDDSTLDEMMEQVQMLLQLQCNVPFGTRGEGRIDFLGFPSGERGSNDQIISQVLCSALEWNATTNSRLKDNLAAQSIGKMLVTAAYVGAVLSAAFLSLPKLYLTTLGTSGPYENDPRWMLDALESDQFTRALETFPVQVILVWHSDPLQPAYEETRERLDKLVTRWNGKYDRYPPKYNN